MATDETTANLNRLLRAERAKVKKRDAKIDALTEKLDEAERALDNHDLGWSRHRPWTAEVGGADLPVPRIEMRWALTGRDEGTALLVLVYRHRRDTVYAVPLGNTRCSGGSYNADDRRRSGLPAAMFTTADGLDTPFRDGVHLTHNAKHLGLRAFITTEFGDVTEIDPETRAQTWIRRAGKAA